MVTTRKTRINELLRSVIGLFYPRICPGCKEMLMTGENLMCVNCLFDLPFAGIHDKPNNTVEERLAGKVKFESASALCYYQKSSVIQSLIHELKYRENTEIGNYLGEMLGRGLKRSIRFNDIDFVIPVPLHPQKLKSRGYNQSDFIAEGICNVMETEVSKDNLVRKINTQTQTTKSIYDRWKNVSKIFDCQRPEQFEGKHVLLVDDVITSGSTLEGCIQSLNQIKDIKVSIALLACAE